MQIPHQLEGKQKSVDLFITFLKEHYLWQRVRIKIIDKSIKIRYI